MTESVKILQTPLSSLDLERDIIKFGYGSGFIKSSILYIKDTICGDLKKALFVTDEVIWKSCRKFFPEKIDNLLLLKSPKADEENLKKIYSCLKGCKLIIGLGSGTINDLCKFTSAQKNIPYVIFISAASMNGYYSKNASITISGHKKTLSATLPTKIFCDLEILSKAPLKLTRAGIGDSLCFYSCWFDWYLSHRILGTNFNNRPFEILVPKMDFFIKNYKDFSIKDKNFLKLLIEILLLSGLGMTISGSSYPASQSEHMIAHTITMRYPKESEDFLHGQLIAITTLTTARLQKLLLNCDRSVQKTIFPQRQLDGFFNKKIVLECREEYSQKLASLNFANQFNKSLKKELQKIHFDEEKLKAIFSYFKIKTSIKSLGISSKEYQKCIKYAKFIRSRFTCLDFYS